MSEYPTDDASEAMRDAHAAAENVARLLDRYWGDAGSDPEIVRGWRDMLTALAFEIERELGEPAERLPSGGLVKRAFLDVYRGE
jgi:hypothetical protein